jgi:cytochrome c oxidase subunit 1
VLGVSPRWFYRLLTVHGSGMLVGAMLAMMGGLWFVLRPSVFLSGARMAWSYATILAGALAVVVAVVVGGFAAGWTFLSPLPFFSAGQWSTWATVTFLVGMALVGIGFFIYCLDVFVSVTATYGGLRSALGIPFLRGRDDSPPPPPPVIAATVVSLEGLLAAAIGTTVVIALISRAIDEKVTLDALWAKNLTFFFGHTFANLIIYLAAGVVYVLLPRYAGRPWRTTKPIVVGWLATLVLVATAYSHHLYMDFVQPRWAEIISTTASYAAAIPVAVVTIYTGMMLIWGSRYRWTLASTLLYLGFAGWAIGGTGAVIDSLIPVNFRLHNTLWVPAHFHTYLLLATIVWAMAFITYMLERAAGRPASRRTTWLAPTLMALGGYGLVAAWFVSGALGIPRRYAVHPPGTAGYSLAGSIFAIVFAVGFLVLLIELATLARDARRRRQERVSAPGAQAADVPRPQPPGPAATPLTGQVQIATAAAAATVALVSLFPPVIDAADATAQWHHLDHAAQFLLGAIIGLALASSRGGGRTTRPRGTAVGLAAIIVAPAAMLLAMTPGIYEGLEHHPFLHFLYHVGIVALGLITGLAAGRFTRTTGRIVFVLSVAMGVMYAAGVSGG